MENQALYNFAFIDEYAENFQFSVGIEKLKKIACRHF